MKKISKTITTIFSIVILNYGCASHSFNKNDIDSVTSFNSGVVPVNIVTNSKLPGYASISNRDTTVIYLAEAEVSETKAVTSGDDPDESDEFEEFDEFEEEFGDAEKIEVFDPLSGYNVIMTVFNDRLYVWVLDPVARFYRWVIPEFVRIGISNFFENLLYPMRVVNNLLQLKFKNAGEETLRFLTNSTIGVLGLWDPAEKWFELEAHEEDFGQTLGHYGVGGGFHIVLPVMGPSNLRDMFSLYPDYELDPVKLVEPYEYQLGVRTFDVVNDTSLHIGEYESLKKDALDLYTFLRDVYEQNRNKKIKE